MVGGRSPVVQHAGALQTIELQARHMAACRQAGGMTKKIADGHGMVLQTPGEAVQHVVVGNGHQLVHEPMKAREQKTNKADLGRDGPRRPRRNDRVAADIREPAT